MGLHFNNKPSFKLTLRRHCIISSCLSSLSAQLSASWTITPMWPAAKIASTPWTSSSNILRNCGKRNDTRKPVRKFPANHPSHVLNHKVCDLPVCIWQMLLLASGWESWRWDGGRGQPAGPWDGSCRARGEVACGTAVWWSLWGDWRPGPSERLEADYGEIKVTQHNILKINKEKTLSGSQTQTLASYLTPGAALRLVRYSMMRRRSCLQSLGRLLWHTVSMVWNTALATASVTLTTKRRSTVETSCQYKGALSWTKQKMLPHWNTLCVNTLILCSSSLPCLCKCVTATSSTRVKLHIQAGVMY